MKLNLVWLLSCYSLLLSSSSLLVAADFNCDDYSNANDLSGVGSFNTLIASMGCPNGFTGGTLPSRINYVLRFVSSGSQAKWKGYPDNTLEPYIDNGALRFRYTQLLTNTNDNAEVGVAIYIPQNYNFASIIGNSPIGNTLRAVATDSSTAPSSVTVVESGNADTWGNGQEDVGNGNKYYLDMPNTQINFSGGGKSWYVEARVKSNSNFQVNGPNAQAKIRNEGNADLIVVMTGQSQQVQVNGNYNTFSMIGRDGRAYINGGNGCNNVSGRDQNGNTCQTNSDSVSVSGVSCTRSDRPVNLIRCFTDSLNVGSSQSGGVSVTTTTTTTMMIMMMMMGLILSALEGVQVM